MTPDFRLICLSSDSPGQGMTAPPGSPAWRCRSIVKGLMKLARRLAQNINTGESDLLA
jgi:hypothetical protein